MTTSTTLRAASTVFLGFTLAAAAMTAQAGKGPADALAVCKAVVQDNPAEVSRLLAAYRAPFAYSYSHLAPGGAAKRDARNMYECNGLPLRDFAQSVGAERTAAFFDGDRLAEDDYIAGSQEAEAAPKS